MAKGQSMLEMLLGYSIAFIIIAAALAILFIFYPNIFSSAPSSTYSGFTGLLVTGQGYCGSGCNATGFYYIRFQNILNENINISKIYFIASGINQSFSTGKCVSTIENSTKVPGSALPNLYIPDLGYAECNLTLSLPTSWTASIDIYYKPANVSSPLFPQAIEIEGAVSG